jgi:hypothetical protein
MDRATIKLRRTLAEAGIDVLRCRVQRSKPGGAKTFPECDLFKNIRNIRRTGFAAPQA